MEVISKTQRFKAIIRKERAAMRRIGFVPTMGALHEGHLSLVRRARRVSDVVVVSIFVNPTQFGPKEDFTAYPRNLAHDVDMLSKLDVHYVFAPTPDEIYPRDFESYVEVEGLSEKLCGAHRAGHFRGVTTVVSKLFTIVEPTWAFFGQKDAQQALIIQKMVRDMNFHVNVSICPTVREPDGLAMSSRNAYLSPAERKAATVLYRALCRAASLVIEGARDTARMLQAMRDVLATEPLAQPEYVEIVDTDQLERLSVLHGQALLALAVRIGQTRLIDNLLVSAP